MKENKSIKLQIEGRINELPVLYRFVEYKNLEGNTPIKIVESEFYQTNQLSLSNYYKPISKIIIIKNV